MAERPIIYWLLKSALLKYYCLFSDGELSPSEAISEVSLIYKSMPSQRKTSARAGKAASKVLRSGSTGRNSKIAAGSALSQRAPKRKR